jgi:Ser/Thr protein kinase RdoA (MazF antagonist)
MSEASLPDAPLTNDVLTNDVLTNDVLTNDVLTNDVFAPAAAEALASFPVVALSVTMVSLSENATFRVEAGDGRTYVLRLHRPGYHSLEELISERVWLRALAGAGIGVPAPVPALDGRDYVPVTVAGTGETRFAGLACWIGGEVMGSLPGLGTDPELTARCYRQLGRVMAGLHDQASGWSPPPSFTRHRLDADGLMGPAPFWGPFWDDPAVDRTRRRLLSAGRERLHAWLLARSRDPGRFSVIHADLHLHNVVMGGDEGELAVIDFDDAGYGWHAYDIAVALLPSADTAQAELTRTALVEGYRSRRDLDDETLAEVPVFELIRMLAVIGWTRQRPEITLPARYLDQLLTTALARLSQLP